MCASVGGVFEGLEGVVQGAGFVNGEDGGAAGGPGLPVHDIWWFWRGGGEDDVVVCAGAGGGDGGG